MRTALTLLAVAVGKLLCRLGRHKWGPWFWDWDRHPLLGWLEIKRRTCQRFGCGRDIIDYIPDVEDWPGRDGNPYPYGYEEVP